MFHFTILFSVLLIHDVLSDFGLTEDEKAIINNDISYLTNGVNRLKHLHGHHTDLQSFRKFAYTLANTTTNNVWNAARYGAGKVCAFSSNDFCQMNSDMLSMEENTRMMENCINWITNQTTGPFQQQPIGFVSTSQFFNKNFAKSPLTEFQTLQDLQNVNFLLLDQTALDRFNSGQIEVVKEFVSKQGGGLFVCNAPWWSDRLEDNKGNLLLLEAGLMWTYKLVDNNAVIGINPELHNLAGKNLWYQANRISESRISDVHDCDLYSQNLAEELLSATRTSGAEIYINAIRINLVFKKCCSTHEPFRFPINKETNRRGYVCVPFAQKIRYLLPLNYEHPIVKAAEVFPGYPKAERKTVSRYVSFILNHTQWHSTGLFVWPGSSLQVQVPSMLVHAGYTIQIGSHTRSLFKSEVTVFQRWPWVVESIEINNATLNLFAFTGGLLYLTVPTVASNLETVKIKFTGELASAPWYKLGITTESQWNDMVSSNVVSYAEIESHLVTMTVSSNVLSEIVNVTKSALWNDAHVMMNYELRGNKFKNYKERMVSDLQIDCLCYLAGYPIMGTEDYGWSKELVTATEDVSVTNDYHRNINYWARYHELGHNFQLAIWTAHYEWEATANIFTLYNEERYPDGPHQFGHYDRPLIKDDDHWGLLSFYIELRQAFGWVAFKQFFRIFENNPTLTKLNSPNAPDNWLMYFSNTVNRNIYPLFIEYNKHNQISTNAMAYALNFPSWDKTKIVGCNGGNAAFLNSPCMTMIWDNNGVLRFKAVAWVRIKYTESLELTFPDAPNEMRMECTETQRVIFSTAFYNQTTKTIRLVPLKMINNEQKFYFTLVSDQLFQINDVKVKIVENASNKVLIHIGERSLEQIIYHE